MLLKLLPLHDTLQLLEHLPLNVPLGCLREPHAELVKDNLPEDVLPPVDPEGKPGWKAAIEEPCDWVCCFIAHNVGGCPLDHGYMAGSVLGKYAQYENMVRATCISILYTLIPGTIVMAVAPDPISATLFPLIIWSCSGVHFWGCTIFPEKLSCPAMLCLPSDIICKLPQQTADIYYSSHSS